MSVQTVDVGLDDSELFEGAMANEAPAPEPVAEKTEPDERPRDEQGRFAPKQEEAPAEKAPEPAEPAKQEQPKDEAHVPSWRLREVSEARQAAEARAQQAERERYQFQAELAQVRQQMAEFQKPKAEPVDFFQNPDAAVQQRLEPIEQRFARMESQFRLNTSRAMALAEYGKPAMEEMTKAIDKAYAEGHPEMSLLQAQMQASDHPVDVAMKWHQRTKLQQETGGDLTAYKAKIMEDALKDPAFLAKALETARTQAGQNGSPKVVIPPSLNKASGSGGNNENLTEGDMTDASLFRHAVTSKRR